MRNYPQRFRLRDPVRWLVFSAAAWLCCATLSAATPAEAAIKPGETAPDFQLKDLEGKVRSFDKTTTGTLLLFFCASGDSHSLKALAALNHMAERHPKILKGVKRVAILNHQIKSDGLESVKKAADKNWPLLSDEDGETFKAYKIVATPTVVIVGADRKVAFVNPGYDLAMEDRVRKSLAKETGVELPPAAVSQPAKPDMDLQMGRRMAARGLWDSALLFYKKSEERGDLTPEAQAELAEIYIELDRPDDALAILRDLKIDEKIRGELIKRAEKLKAGGAETGAPPKVVR